MSKFQEQNVHNSDRHSEYIELLMGNLNSIYRYIVTMVPNVADADDLLQDTSVLIWQKFNTYQKGTSFKNWALTIARYKIMYYYRSKNNSRVKFSSQTIDAISDSLAKSKDDKDEDMKLLNKCLSKLKEKDRSLIELKYSQQVSTKQLAIQFGRSASGLYTTLARIHRLLVKCVRAHLSEETI